MSRWFEPPAAFFQLLAQTTSAAFNPPYRWRETLNQMVFVIYESAPVILFSVGFAAAVTIIESSFHMKIVINNDSLVPGFASLLILRELGAVVMALLLTSRVGAGLAAEVATQQISEQIDALKMLSIDPIKYIVMPRWLACTLGGLILSLMANLFCLWVAMLVTQVRLGYSSASFIAAMSAFVSFQDLIFAGIKGAVFGSVIPIFSCFYGFRCSSGAEGVGMATTKSVVSTSIAIIFLDFILGYVFSFFY